MDKSLFFSNVTKNNKNENTINFFSEYSSKKAKQVYIINSPLNSQSLDETIYEDALVILIPGKKICLLNLNENAAKEFDEFSEDFLEDLGYLSDKYDYKKILGRPRIWRNNLLVKMNISGCGDEYNSLFNDIELTSKKEQRNADFLISLLIGSINDINRVGYYPETLLDQVKHKIILFDGDQSRFIYSNVPSKKKITIQGLAGTGKTELLLHKLKDLYIRDKTSKIVFTCFNKILAESMRSRVPEFFDFMRVDEQIKWEERLWVMSSWGSSGVKNSGLYSYICSNYNLTFHPFSAKWSFEKVCAAALKELKEQDEITPCFDYILIDESQDFSQSFFELCELITNKTMYIAGDIFQDIYDRTLNQSVHSDFLLNKCYRTDPKTLMFAHAVGMGLYETPVIRWLDDEEWVSCGYQIDRSEGEFQLSRMPLRRFEDIETTNIPSIEVIEASDDYVKDVISIIDEIREQNPSVKACDIAVVFLESNNSNYKFADLLQLAINKKYKNWSAIKGYETKSTSEDAVFISNKNNIKGLEFPFVICVINEELTRNVFKRNTVYMMLTRSFITSYLLVDKINHNFFEIYKDIPKTIQINGTMKLIEPTDEEKKLQNQKVQIEVNESAKKRRPINDIISEIVDSYPQLSSKNKSIIKKSILSFIEEQGQISEDEIKIRTKKFVDAFI